ncbi:MAG: VanZ family protein [Chitinophagales bacterium]
MRNLFNKKISKIIPALLWSGIIFFLCFLPGSAFPKEDWLDKIYFDKIVHAFLYLILFFLIIRIFENKTTLSLLTASVLCIAQGILIEFVQGSSFIEHRSFDVYDIAANIFGVISGIIMAYKKHKTI